MKFKEYLESKENKKGKKGSLKKGVVKTPSVLKAFIIGIFKAIRIIFRFIQYLIDQAAEALACLLCIKNEKMSVDRKINFWKAVVKIFALLIIVVILSFGHMHNKNKKLEEQVATINASIESNSEAPKQSKEQIAKATEEAKKEVEKVVAKKSATPTPVTNDTSTNTNASNTLKDAKNTEFFGSDSIKVKLGKVDPAYYTRKGYCRYKDNKGNVKVDIVCLYGIGEFSSSPNSGTRYVKNVTDYVKSRDVEMYNKYFKDVNVPGTTTFTTGWQDAASDEKDKFLQYQFEYLYINYVNPTMSALVDKYGIDKDNDGIKEFVFSTSVQYGYKGTMAIFEKAGIKKGMSAKEIVKKVQDEKYNSVGVYTYTEEYKYDKYDRENIKAEITKETDLFIAKL